MKRQKPRAAIAPTTTAPMAAPIPAMVAVASPPRGGGATVVAVSRFDEEVGVMG